MQERVDQSDRERLSNIAAYCAWCDAMANDQYAEASDMDHGTVAEGATICASATGVRQRPAMLAWARQEIARLEALECTDCIAEAIGEATRADMYEPPTPFRRDLTSQCVDEGGKAHAFHDGVPNIAPDPGWHAIGKIDGAGIITKPGDVLSVDIIEQKWTVLPGKTRLYISRDAYHTLCGEPTEQPLDDFIRDRDRKAACQRANDMSRNAEVQAGYARDMEDREHKQQPASRDLVGRMVREATSHSLWPVSFYQLDDEDGEPHYKISLKTSLGWTDMNVGYGAWSDFNAPYSTTMAALLEACDEAKAFVDYNNSRACPACNGKGKTPGYFFGEKQCTDCEGTGVR